MKLVTFPGQGSSINLGSFKGWCESLETFKHGKDAFKKEVLEFVGSNLNNPGSIAVCSNLLFQDWLERNSNKLNRLAILGHSLGELSAINACSTNRVYSFRDIFEIANYRHGLMIAATTDHSLKLGLAEWEKYRLWSITCVKSRDLRGELQLFGSLHVANHNSRVQCVVTGLKDDFELLKLPKGSRVNELENPSHIPFHDEVVLNGIQEPLYDYMKEKLARNGIESRMTLDFPMICNVDGNVVSTLDAALEQFAKSSTRTVEFPKCCHTALTMGATSTLHIGPGKAVKSFLARNMEVEDSETYGE